MSNDYPLISIVIPVYNAAAFLRATVADVQAQTYPELEILLVDDGSADDSYAVCLALAAQDPRIHAFHKENGGASTARNLGIRNAHGELIGFVDSDDHIRPQMVEHLYQAYCKWSRKLDTDLLLVQTGREEIDEEGNALPAVLATPDEEVFERPEEFIRSLLLYTGDASYCTKLVPRQCFLCGDKELLFPEGQMGEDFLLHVLMLPEIAGVVRIPETDYRVVHRRGSATRRAGANEFSRVYIDIVRHADYVEQITTQIYPGLKAAALRFGLYERLDYLLHVPISDMTRGNDFYVETVQYIRKNFGAMLKSPHLTRKNKLYLTLLTAAPRTTRRIHLLLRGKRIQ